MCERNHNFKSSCDNLFGRVEDIHAISIMSIRGLCDFFGNKKNITENLNICASHLLKQKSSARLFSPSARPLLLWFVVLVRHGVMASAVIDFLCIPVLLSSFQLMDDDISLRTVYWLCDKVRSGKMVWQKLIQNLAFDQDSEEIHPRILRMSIR